MRFLIRLGVAVALVSVSMVVVFSRTAPSPTLPTRTDASDDVRAGVLRVMRDEGVPAAVSWFSGQVASLPSLSYDCHGLAHETGQLAASRIGAASAVTLAPELCQGGYLHGVLQVAAADASVTARICTLVPTEYRSACAHGYGHLLAARYPTSIDDALRVCAALYDQAEPISAKDVSRCGGGAAMEYGAALSAGLGLNQEAHAASMGPLEPVAADLPAQQLRNPCRVLQALSDPDLTEAHFECTSHLALFWMSHADVTYEDVIQRCPPAGADRPDLCAVSVGMRFTELDLQDAPEVASVVLAVENRCAKSPESLQHACRKGSYFTVLRQGLVVPACESTLACREASAMLEADRSQ